MKLPKTIQICGLKVVVRQDPKRFDGEYDLKTKVMTIGTGSPAQIPEIFLHEVIEAILYERGHRYTCYTEGNDGIRFVLSHKEYENLIKDILSSFPSLLKK